MWWGGPGPTGSGAPGGLVGLVAIRRDQTLPGRSIATGPTTQPGQALVSHASALREREPYLGRAMTRTLAVGKPASRNRATCAWAWAMVGNWPLATATKA